MLISSEPIDQTLDRRTRLTSLYPELSLSSPTQIAQVDASSPDTPPTQFTQDMVKYGVAATDAIQSPETFQGSWLSRTMPPLGPVGPDQGPVGPQGPIGPDSGGGSTPVLSGIGQGLSALGGLAHQAPVLGGIGDAWQEAQQQPLANTSPLTFEAGPYDPNPTSVSPVDPSSVMLGMYGFENGGLKAIPAIASAAGAIGAPALANHLLPDNTDPRVRGVIDVGAMLAGGYAGHAFGGGLAGGLESPTTPVPAPVAHTAPDEAAPFLPAEHQQALVDAGVSPQDAAQMTPEDYQRFHDQHYGGVQATGREPISDAERERIAQLPPLTADQIAAGNDAAYQRSIGNTAPLDPNARTLSPVDNLLQRISDAKPLQEQNAELLSQFRSRQAGAFSGALDSGPGGEAGFNRALGAMRGQAERVTFEPLRPAIPEAQQGQLFDAVTQHPDLRPFEKAQAGDALRNILDGQVPTPSSLAQLETAFPGVTKALQSANIVKGPSLWERIPTSIQDVNNSIRSANTLLDFAFMGRLGPQAGLMQPRTFARSVGQAWKSIAQPEIVQNVWNNLDENAQASRYLPTVDQMRSDYGLKVVNPDTNPGALGRIPGVGRLANVYQNFQKLLRPQMLQQEIQNRIDAGSLKPQDLQNPAITKDLGRSINLITGSSSLDINPDANLLLEFPNWLAAQGELIVRAATNGNITGQMARQSLMRLVAFGTASTAAINLAQGRSPIADTHNGVPMAHVPDGVANALHLKRGTTVDMFGPLGELVSKAAGIGIATAQGAQSGGLSGALQKGGGEAFYQYRGLESPLAGIGIDQITGKDWNGNPLGSPLARIMDIIKSAVPFNVETAVEGTRSPGAQVGGAAGLRLHEPGVTAQVNQGDYSRLVPADQVTAIPVQGWRLIQADAKAPPELKQYDSYYAWADAERARLTPLATEEGTRLGKSPGEIADAVQKRIDASPVTKAWGNARTHLKDEWVVTNPQLALDNYDKNQALGYRDQKPEWSLTQKQIAAAHAALSAAQR